MRRNRRDRQQSPSSHRDPRFGQVLFASLGVHIAVVLLLSGVLIPPRKQPSRPVYHVDLVNLPVRNPQAGRPDAAPEPRKAEPKPKPQETAKLVKPEPVRPAVPIKKPEAAKPVPKETADPLTAIEKMRQRRDQEDLKQRLAQMQASRTEAPVGIPTGKGTEKGSSWDLWIREFLKSNWSLSKYQVTRRDLQTEVSIVYDAQGTLVDYKIEKSSGDATFDDSVKKAILLERQLPQKPGEKMEFEVVFNLKELME